MGVAGPHPKQGAASTIYRAFGVPRIPDRVPVLLEERTTHRRAPQPDAPVQNNPKRTSWWATRRQLVGNLGYRLALVDAAAAHHDRSYERSLLMLSYHRSDVGVINQPPLTKDRWEPIPTGD
jgi:hypothetical protein